MHKTGLTELEAVVAVARRGSFRGAAIELGMSTTALSNAVAGLEARLGVRLFHRTTRSVALTDAGRRFVTSVAPALQDIHTAMNAVDAERNTPSGTIRINTFTGAARAMLRPLVLEYLRRYPEVKIDIVTEGRLLDIVADGFDFGIRYADAVPADMIALPLKREQRMAVVAAPGYFKSRSRPKTPSELRDHTCIRARLANGAIYRWEFEKEKRSTTIDVQGTLTLDEETLIHEAALAGAGLAYLPEHTVQSDIQSKRLVRVLAEWTPPFPGLSLYYSGRRNLPAAMRAFIALARSISR